MYASKDAKTATVSTKVWLLLNIFIYILFFFMGILARVLIKSGSLPGGNEDFASTMLVRQTLSSVFGAIIIACFSGIVMSTADTYLLSSSTNAVRDIYQRFINPKASASKIKNLSRIMVLVISLVALIAAFLFPMVLDLAVFAYTLYGTGIAIPLISAMFWKRANKVGGMASIITGFTIALGWKLAFPGGYYGVGPIIPAIIGSALAMVIGSMITTPPPEEKWKPFLLKLSQE
jgi:Na+/proline symporter